MLKKWILIFSLVLSLGLVWAQVPFQATYTFGSDGNVASFVYNGTSYAGITMGNLEKIGITSTSSTNNFRGSGWSLTDIDTEKYIGFTISAVTGYKFTVNSISFGIGRSGTGTRYSQWRGSNDGYSAVINNYTSLNSGLTNNDGVLNNPDENSNWTGNVLDMGTSYQDITDSAGFRIFMYNAEGTAGTAGLQGPITISGTYQLVGANPNAEPPTFNPIAGEYFSTQYVTLSCATPSASIYYTVDGSTPTDMSTLFTTAIEVSQSTTIKAIAYAMGYMPSGVAIAEYIISTPNLATIPYTQSFDSDLGDTYTYNVSGPSKTWYYYASTSAAAINGYNSGDIEEDWLILPGLNMNTNSYEVMSFDTWYNYNTLGVDNYLKLYYSSNYAGIGDPTTATWTEVSFTQPSSTSTWTGSGLLDLSGVTGTAVFFAFKYYSVPGNYSSWNIDNISIINLPPDQPLLTVNPATLTGFTYITGEGPSAAQMFSVSGTNLTANVIVQAPANYEISINETAEFTSSITLTQAGGTVAETPLYARLEAGLSIGNYNELITVNSTGAAEATLSLSGSVSGPLPYAQILQRPTQINLNDPTYESAVLVEVGNYPTDDVRYRLYSGGTQYYPWNAATEAWVSSSSYGDGPQAPGTPSSSSSWWIPFQIGSNPTVVASYRDRLGPAYGTNYQTAGLPEATLITNAEPIISSQVSFNTWNDYSAKHVVLAYDASDVLIAAASTGIGDGSFTIWVEAGTAITRIEVRDVLNNLLESVTGTWPQVLNPQITVSGSLDPLYNIAGQPSEEFGQYTVSADDLTDDISVVAPSHFEITLDSANGPWVSTLTLAPDFNGSIYVRINSEVVGEHSGDITHNSTGATEATIRVEGETFPPLGEIIVNSSMTAFTQEVGTPSTAQTYSLSSTGLSSDIVVTAGAPFEISSDAGTNWATSISVPHTFDGLISVRMNSDQVGTFTDIAITHSNTNATPASILVSGVANPAGGEVDNLFFSEYIEGSTGNNKVIEIFNATDHDVDLSRYQVELYSNGATTPGSTELLSGILASGDVFVIANSGSVQTILDQADVTSTVCYFNGDDALALRCLNPNTIIDVFGVLGTDPGSAWAVAGVTGATADHTLIRKPTVSSGNTDWAVQAGTDANNSEWIVHPDAYYDDLGSHTYNPGALLAAAPVFDPAAGVYSAPINVSISSETTGAEIRYTTDGSDPSQTVGTIYTAPIPVSTNTTIRAIAYAAGYDPSIIMEAVYSFTIPISDIATLRAQVTGSGNIYSLTGEAVLTYQNANRNTKYIQDATAAIVIDDNSGNISTTYNLYDGITGITGYLNPYNGLLQFVPVADPGAATSSNNVVVPEVRTLASLTSADQAKLIKVMGATITHATMTQFPSYATNMNVSDSSISSLTLRTFPNTDYAGTDIPLEPVTLTCLVGQFNTSMQVSPRFLSDIETGGGALDTPVVTIELSGSNVLLTWPDVDGAGSYRIEASDDPYGTFTTLGTTSDIGYSVPAADAKKFYRVIALP